MFEDFSKKELKYYFGFGFIFFILDTFAFINLFFRYVYNWNIQLYTVLLIHDISYILSYSILIGLLSFFFKLNLKRAVLFTAPQFYIYEYAGGFFIQGFDYLHLSFKVFLMRLLILATGTTLIYLVFKRILRRS